MLHLLNNDIPLKAYVLRIRRILELKGWTLNESTVKLTVQGTYVTLKGTRENNTINVTISPLSDDMKILVCNETEHELYNNEMDIYKLVEWQF